MIYFARALQMIGVLRLRFNGAYNENEIEDLANESGFTGVTARLQEGRPAFSHGLINAG